MARSSMENESRSNGLIDRLEMIRNRHRALILEPRKSLEQDFDAEFDTDLDELHDEEQVEIAQIAEF